MEWFKKAKTGVFTETKRDIPTNLWIKCDSCKEVLYRKELDKADSVCMHCGFHFRINPEDYVRILLDEESFEEMDQDLETNDPLKFVAHKKYRDSIAGAQKKTGRKNGVFSGVGALHGRQVAIGIMDFRFVGGSMGSVEGEKIARVFKKALELNCPAIVISASGGARMQEGALSLMQMAKTSAYLSQMHERAIPYISLLTNPTTGGVTASFSMLGDVNIAEPGALIGFAGERVIRETIRQNLPDGFQRAEFLMEHGFVDRIIKRTALKQEIHLLLSHFLD